MEFQSIKLLPIFPYQGKMNDKHLAMYEGLRACKVKPVMNFFLFHINVAKDLLQNMLCVDTTSRYTARRILDDPWFTVSHIYV